MKKIIVSLLAVLLCVGSSYASTLEVTGSAHFRGRSTQNKIVYDGDDSKTNSFYDFEMTIQPKFVVDENTFAFASFEMRDQTVDETETGNVDGELDDNILVEKAYFGTKIGPTSLTVGLMDGGMWGTSFNDSNVPEWRIKTITTTPVGSLVCVVRKQLESDKTDSKDNDVYYLGFVTKLGPVYVKPLLVYGHANEIEDTQLGEHPIHGVPMSISSSKLEQNVAILALNGTFGNVSFESEFVYEKYTLKDSVLNASAPMPNQTDIDIDHQLYGFFLDVNLKLDENKVGAIIVYAGTDESEFGSHHGLSYGDERAFTVLLDDDMSLGSTQKAGMGGYSMLQLYSSLVVTDSLTVSPSISYVSSNYEDDNNITEIESGIEVDICSTYKINDAVSYSVDVAYAQVSAYEGTDPEDMWLLRHKIAIAF